MHHLQPYNRPLAPPRPISSNARPSATPSSNPIPPHPAQPNPRSAPLRPAPPKFAARLLTNSGTISGERGGGRPPTPPPGSVPTHYLLPLSARHVSLLNISPLPAWLQQVSTKTHFAHNSKTYYQFFDRSLIRRSIDMLKEELSGGGNHRGDTWARVCDTCRSAPSRVYCRADAAYLCAGCDTRLHASASGHERVWVCEACERAPAAFTCKADAASLCADCDAKVHSANPLARRHQRFPILPISGCLYGSAATNPGRRALALAATMGESEDRFDEDDEDEAASWLVLNPSNNNNNTKEINNNNNTNGCSLGGEVVDEYLDLVEFDLGGYNARLNDETTYSHRSIQQSHQYAVPVGVGEGNNGMHEHHTFQMGLDYDIKSDHYAYNNTLSIGHSVSVSSLDVGIVPDTTTSDISTSQARHSKGTIDLFSSPSLQQMPTQLSPMDREARVLRYREKKKTRKFEKTIRYASRKAYAETRPRIKGRFAKRKDIEAEVEQMFPSMVMADTGYSVVPSF